MKCEICDKEINQLQGRNRKRCNGCNTSIRRLRGKLKAIELLGGKCERCGYNKHPAALEFHHKDSKDKDFIIGSISNRSWEVVKEEAMKCELLCSNCHRIEHSSRFDNPRMIDIINRGIS